MSEPSGDPPVNGHHDDWIAYGDQPYHVMPRAEVEPLLRLLREREPQVFARLRAELMTGDKYTITRKRAD